MQPSLRNSDIVQHKYIKGAHRLPRTLLKYAHIYISIMESILWMMRVLQLLCQRKKNMRMCDTWKLATCFAAALNSELMCVSEEILTGTGVNRACTQSLFLQPVEATDRLSRTCMISQLWPACTWLAKPEDCKATGECGNHPARGLKIKFLVDTQHEFDLFHLLFLLFVLF